MGAGDNEKAPERQVLLAEIAQLRSRLAAAEEALRQAPSGKAHTSGVSEEKYRLLFANMAEVFALYELVYDEAGEPVDWRVLEVNDAYTIHTGIAREQIVGRRVGELYPAAVPEYLPRFARVVASQEATEFETYAAGIKRYQRVFCFPAGPHRFANTITDITSRMIAEEALREQELRATALINAADESIWLFGLQGEILAANTTAARRVGKTVAELVGQRWPELLSPELVTARAARVAEVVRSKAPLRFEDERAGMVFDHSAYPVCDATGTVTAVAFFSRDISERRQAEAAQRQQDEDLRRAQAVGSLGSWRLNVVRNELVWSDENHRIFGIPRGTPLTYETFLAAIHPDDRAFVDAQWQAALSGAPYDIEHRLVVGHQVKWVHEKAYLEFAPDGSLLGGFGITQDITRLKQAEEALHRAKTVAEAATRAKSQFLANMSHELRTPMAGVLGMLEHVLAGQLDAEQREYIGIAQTSARSLVRILNDILDLTRIEAGKFSIEEKPFAIRGCVENTYNLLLPVARKKGLALHYSVAEGVPQLVLGDQIRLNQVLNNLLGNAVKFTAAGEVSLRVTAEEEGARDGKVAITFSVADTGIGIPADKKDRLFHLFSQVDESHSRAYGGAGLGLVISKEIVERMGGMISLTSAEGCGSVFSFTIPFSADASVVSTVVAEPGPARSVWSGGSLKGPRLLVAEDEAVIRQVLGILLTRSDFAVDYAASGEEALAGFRTGGYALILMDVQMPGLNGFEVTAAIRREEAGKGVHIPIIAVTAHALKEDEERCLAAGMDAYLSKPIDFQECLQLITDLLKRYPA